MDAERSRSVETMSKCSPTSGKGGEGCSVKRVFSLSRFVGDAEAPERETKGLEVVFTRTNGDDGDTSAAAG